MKAPRIGLIGCGRWGRHILRDLRSLGCDVVVVARSHDSLRNAEDGGAALIVERDADLPEVAGIVIATTTVAHAEVIDRVLNRGVPIFCEKPLCCDVDSARSLAAQGAGRLFVMDKWRYHPGIEKLAQIVRKKSLGEPLGLKTLRVGWGNPHLDVDIDWILVPHELSIALEVLGRVPTPQSAVASIEKGRLTGMTALFAGTEWMSMEIGSRSLQWVRTVSLQCEGGMAVLSDGFSDHIQVTRWKPGTESPAPEPEAIPISTELPLLRELKAFVDHLGGGPPPRSSAEEGAQIVETIAALRRLAGVSPQS